MQEVDGFDRRSLDAARISRDPRFDGRFFIAVRTTGIYCRPICPAPRCKSRNVRYYPTAAAAASAGYRPCLRCRPEAAPGTPAWLGTSAVVRRALRLIHDGALDETGVVDLALRVGVGPRHLHRLFLRHVGASPVTVAQTRRLHFAKRLLDDAGLPMTQVALAAGYGSLRRFNHAFQEAYGKSPRELRRQGRSGATPVADGEIVLKLSYRPPYDWEQVSGFLARESCAGVERVDATGYARTVETADGAATIRVAPAAGEHALLLRVRGAAPAALFQVSASVRRAFDLAADPFAIAGALSADPRLARLVRRRPGLRIPGSWDPFECAVRVMLALHLAPATSRAIAERLAERYGKPVGTGEPGLTRLFPRAPALVRSNLESLGLPAARAASLRALARAVDGGRIDFSAPVDEVRGALAAIQGVGESVAEYVAMRALAEPDALPGAHLALRRAVARRAGALGARRLLERAEAWRPWRSYAAMQFLCD
jgi:AraC family transcriptional regulator of adaptative response / DNA-3-methyladenine glycosylase II